MPPPPQNPAFQIWSHPDPHGELRPAPWELLQFLRFVPLPFPGQPRRKGIKPNPHPINSPRLEGGKTPRQHLGHGKICRTLKRNLLILRGNNPGESKGAQSIPHQIIGNEVPLVANAGEMVGLHLPTFGLGRTQARIIKLHHPARHHRIGQHLKHLDLCLRHSRRPKGHRLGKVVQRDARLISKTGNQFLEGGMQRLLEGCPPILLNRLLRHQQGHQLPLAHRNHGKLRHHPRIEIPIALRVVGDGQNQLIPHELDVPLDRFCRNLKRLSQNPTIWKFPRHQQFMQPHHPHQRRPGRPGGRHSLPRRFRNPRKLFLFSLNFLWHWTSYVLPLGAKSRAL